jgi:hypothetical protein
MLGLEGSLPVGPSEAQLLLQKNRAQPIQTGVKTHEPAPPPVSATLPPTSPPFPFPARVLSFPSTPTPPAAPGPSAMKTETQNLEEILRAQLEEQKIAEVSHPFLPPCPRGSTPNACGRITSAAAWRSFVYG